MGRVLIAVLAAALLVPAGASASARFVPGEALVRFEPGADAADRRAAREGAGVALEDVLDLPRTQLVTTDGGVRDAVAQLEGQPGVADAQPNLVYHATAAAPNDTHFGQLWGLAAPAPGTDVLPAWDTTRGGGALIAVLDSGVDLTHPDIAPNLWSGPGGIRGHDFVDGDSNPDDLQYHGTHVAGTAAAVANNGQGVAGVAPAADIMAVRVLDGDGAGSSADIAQGIAFASGQGADVINLSLAGPSGTGDAAIGNAAALAQQRGSMLVAAAGNQATNNDVEPQSPCNLPNANVICVAAVDNQGDLASYSNFGSQSVDVAAPGGDSDAGDLEVLSAKPAWLTRFDENFDAIAGEWTQSGTGVAWGLQSNSTNSFGSDSPGVQYANNSTSQITATSATDLAGQHGCRLRFDYLVDMNADPDDFLTVGVQTPGDTFDADFGGSDAEAVEVSLPEIDGQSVKPLLRLTSDASVQDDGAFVDDLRIACRGGAPGDYDDDIVAADLFDVSAGSGGGSYMAISGTSMAAPHVAGVAALVRSADPGSSAPQVVEALRNGTEALPSLAGKTRTGGTVDAVKSIQASLAIPNPVPAPPTPASPVSPPPVPPNRARILRASVNRKGIVRMVVRAQIGVTGVVTLSANVRPSAARVMRVARKRFQVGETRRATVRLRLKRAARRQLLRNRRLRIRSKIVLTNGFGLKSTARRAITTRLPRR